MSSTSSSSTSSSSGTSDTNTESEGDWKTKYVPVPSKALSLKFFAYAAGGTLPTVVKKMTRKPQKDRHGTSEWFFWGREMRLFWVASSEPRTSRRISQGRGRAASIPRPPAFRPPQPLSGFAPGGVPQHGGIMGGAPPPPPTGGMSSATASHPGYVNTHPRPPGRSTSNFPGGIPIPPLA